MVTFGAERGKIEPQQAAEESSESLSKCTFWHRGHYAESNSMLLFMDINEMMEC